jgi:hypothetical protein
MISHVLSKQFKLVLSYQHLWGTPMLEIVVLTLWFGKSHLVLFSVCSFVSPLCFLVKI